MASRREGVEAEVGRGLEGPPSQPSALSLGPGAGWKWKPGRLGLLVEPSVLTHLLTQYRFGLARDPDPLQPGASRPDCGGWTAGRAPLRAAQLLGDRAMDQGWAGAGHGPGPQR